MSGDLTVNVVLIFKESGYQIILTKLLPQDITISEYLIPLGCQVSGYSILTCKEYIKLTIHGYFSILKSNHLLWISNNI